MDRAVPGDVPRPEEPARHPERLPQPAGPVNNAIHTQTQATISTNKRHATQLQ